METSELVLMPWAQARRRLEGTDHALRILTPPYAAIGGGELRVLRVRERAGAPLDVLCGYERYRRP